MPPALPAIVLAGALLLSACDHTKPKGNRVDSIRPASPTSTCLNKTYWTLDMTEYGTGRKYLLCVPQSVAERQLPGAPFKP